jgi:hypothetical protein
MRLMIQMIQSKGKLLLMMLATDRQLHQMMHDAGGPASAWVL